MDCKACKSPCVGTYRQNLNAGRSAWCWEYLRESKGEKMIDMKDYRYHRSHRQDGRILEAAKYRKKAELSQEELDMEDTAEDIIESMNDDLDNVLTNNTAESKL